MPKATLAAVFVEPGRITLREKPPSEGRALDALLRITTATICGIFEAALSALRPGGTLSSLSVSSGLRSKMNANPL